ncbi:hypothetical protein ENUP19_0142G0011 [Entamoeba nuttalli]|uniref:Uncharacterized protein n=1 Tax=Entamoeba nuttalli TaxID=412467 RepID=A0ABQ0DKE9_9EUKA
MSITNKTTKQETLIRKDELNKNTFKVTVNTDDINILTTTNGITTFTSENYIDGIQLITQVPEPKLQSKVVNITQNGTYEIKPDDDLDALESVIVGTNVPQYKIDSIKIYNNGYTLATVATDAIYITENDTDIADLIPADGKLHRIVNDIQGYLYIYATKKDSYQYVLFTHYMAHPTGYFYVKEMESDIKTILYPNGQQYVLKLLTSPLNGGQIDFCKGTTLENLTPLFSYDINYSKTTTETSTAATIILYDTIISENFPIQ